jgi:hypothetical protein
MEVLSARLGPDGWCVLLNDELTSGGVIMHSDE